MAEVKTTTRESWRHLAAGLVLLLLLPRFVAAADLELRFLDVGQGDAALIRLDGKAVLVDTGPSDAMVDQLRRLGVTGLDLLVITHNHADHLGGADAVLAELPVQRYLDNGFPAKTKLQETVLDLVEARGVDYLEATARTVSLGDATLRILPPLAHAAGDDQNDRSLGLLVERGRFRALLPGDAEVAALSAWLAAALVPDLDLLKAAHHGSRNGVTPLLMQRGRPEIVVVSCAAGNDYGHPHAAAMRYYQAAGRRVYRTDVEGEIVFWIAGDGAYRVELPGRAAPSAATAAPRAPVVAPPPPAGSPSAATSPPPRVASPPGPAPAPGTSACCRVCRKGKACGDGCVPKNQTCSQPKGCACDG